jgi:HAD superfamily hydrolase (TIGR01509 family)
MKFDTLIFDMDGVVIDSEVLFDVADTEFFRRHNTVYNREEVALLLTGMHFREATALIKEKWKFDSELDSLISERSNLLEEQYRTHLEYITGFEDFFERVKGIGLKTCIATSSVDQLLKLANDRLKLTAKFGPHIYKTSDVGNVSKPNPAIYLYAANKMDTSPDKCFVIEDAPKGIQAAKNADMFCIGITTSFAKDRLSHADMVIDSYEELNLEQIISS